MIRLRSFRQTDIEAIDKIWREHHANDFSVPDRENMVIDAVVEKDGEVVAYGQVRLFAEFMMILDKSASQRDKIEALKLLMLEGFRGSNEAQLKRFYMFIRDPGFATLITRHFGFEIVDEPGELLLRKND